MRDSSYVIESLGTSLKLAREHTVPRIGQVTARHSQWMLFAITESRLLTSIEASSHLPVRLDRVLVPIGPHSGPSRGNKLSDQYHNEFPFTRFISAKTRQK